MGGIDKQRERLIYLRDAQPTTEFERIAKAIKVKVVSHNGGIVHDVDMWEVLKYPTAFELTTLEIVGHESIDPWHAHG